MSETRWILCVFAAVGLGVLLRVGVSAVSRVQTARSRLLLTLGGLCVFFLVQALLLRVVLTVVQLEAAFVPALLAVALADLLALAVLLLCYCTRRKRRLTDAQKLELSEL